MHGTHKQSCTSMNLSPRSHTKRTFTRYFPSQRRQHTHKPSWKCQRAQKRHDHTSTFLWHCINSLPFPFTADEALALARNSHCGYSSKPRPRLRAFGDLAETKARARGVLCASLTRAAPQEEWRRSRRRGGAGVLRPHSFTPTRLKHAHDTRISLPHT